MRHICRFVGLQRKGMALLLVMFIAFASLVLLTTLLASVAPRRASVSGELQADRALAVADGKIDLIMNTINTFPQLRVDNLLAESDVQPAIIAGWEGMLNGYDSGLNDEANAFNVSTYFYHTTTDTWYAVWNITDTPYHLMSIDAATKLGREVGPTDSTSDTVLELRVWNLSTNTLEPSSIIGMFPNCRTNNEWFEVDTNARHDATDVWTIRASAYLLSRTGIVRTLEAKADKKVGVTTTPPTTTEVYNWFTDVDRTWSFSDYVFLYNFDANLGQYAEVNGYIHANGIMNMGGKAHYPVSATEHVTAIATDDGNKPDGRFGPLEQLLSWAQTNYLKGDKYAENHAPTVNWVAVGTALIGASGVRTPLSETGMQDVAGDDYYFSNDVTVEFGVDTSKTPNVGQVRFKTGATFGLWLPMPSNGVIYVNGTATVSGTVLGSCMVGTSGDILIAGDILYSTLPRTEENAPAQEKPDFLGLVANRNIVIPYTTYVADKNLIIDAAMAADGWIGIDNDWQWHNLDINELTAPTLVVNGSIAKGLGTHMFTGGMQTVTINHKQVKQIKGYDLRQYNFDWDLKQVGSLTGFPTTGTGMTPMPTIVSEASMLKYGIVSSTAEYDTLVSHLTNPSIHPVGNPVDFGGRAYYAEQTGTQVTGGWSGTGFVKDFMYRIGWKEQVGEPVGGN